MLLSWPQHRPHLNCGKGWHVILEPLYLNEILWAQYVYTRRDGLCNLQAASIISGTLLYKRWWQYCLALMRQKMQETDGTRQHTLM